MRKLTSYRRVLALFLTAFMLFTCLPVTALAAENADISEEIQQENQSPQENAGEPTDFDSEDETDQDEPEILQPEEPEDLPEEGIEPSDPEPEEPDSEIKPAEPDAAEQETASAPKELTESISLNTGKEIDALSDLPADDPLAGFTFWLVKGNQQDCVLQNDETGYYLSLPIGDLKGGVLYVKAPEDIADFSVEYEQYVYEGGLITNAHNFVQLLPDRNGSIAIPGLIALGYPEYTNQITLNIDGESYFVQIRPYCQLGVVTVSCGGSSCTIRQDSETGWSAAVSGDIVTLTISSSGTSGMSGEWYSTGRISVDGTEIELDTSRAQSEIDISNQTEDIVISIAVSTQGVLPAEIETRTYTLTLKRVYADKTPQVSKKTLTFQIDGVSQGSSATLFVNQGSEYTLALAGEIDEDSVDDNTTYTWTATKNQGETVVLGSGRTVTLTASEIAAFTSVNCAITNIADGFAYTWTSQNGNIYILPGDGEKVPTPTITVQPESAQYKAGQTATPLTVAASGITGIPLIAGFTYQWYSNTENSTEGGTPISGATKITYTPPAEAVETTYYYCEIKNFIGASITNRYYSDPVYSSIARIQVISPELTMEGEGTESDPYLVETAEHLAEIREQVRAGSFFKGIYFKMTADITLPDGWEPIGTTKIGTPSAYPDYTDGGHGVNMLPFSGTLDGDGHTITVPEGGLPLFTFVRSATVKNLNIFGKRIEGYGLVNNYCVDYGPDGNSTSGEDGGSYTAGCPDTIDIINCTIQSGTRIRYSGFLGGYASGANTVRFINCTVEEGVEIGFGAVDYQNPGTGVHQHELYIGSFAGEFNGIMTNCTSAATVHGADIVGGLIGAKGQSMGLCQVYNSSFTGTIINHSPTGFTGGIQGYGYNSPNSPTITIQNCFVSGNLQGGRNMGGIVGSEGNVVQAWGNGSGGLQNNVFYGTMTPSADSGNIGGLAGRYTSLNMYSDLSGNYFLNTDVKTPLGAVSYVDTSYADHETASGAVYFNTSVSLPDIKGVTKMNHNRDDDPLGKDIDKMGVGITANQLLGVETITVGEGNNQAEKTLIQLLNEGEKSYHNWIQDADGYPVLSSVPIAYQLTIENYKDTYYVGQSLDWTGATFTATWSDGATTTPAAADIVVTGFDNTKQNVSHVTLTYGAAKVEINVRVLLEPSGNADADSITVYLTLLGDVVHDTDENGYGIPTANGGPHTQRKGNLVSWITNESYTLDLNATVWDLLQAAADRHSSDGLAFWNPTGNYVEAVTWQNVTLAEFTNGQASGWMYTLGGNHPDLGVSEQFLADGNRIVFHYTDDYAQEEGSENWVSPPGDSGGSGALGPVSNPVSNPVISVSATANSKGEAAVQVSESALKDAITEAKRGADTITVRSEVTGSAATVSVSLPKAAAAEVVRQTSAELCIETPAGQIEISNDTLSALLDAAKGTDLTLIITERTAGQAQELLKRVAEAASPAQIVGSVVTEVNLTSGKTPITTWGGKALTLYIPVDNTNFEAGKSYTVYQFSEDGTSEELAGTCLELGKQLFVQITVTHLSTFVVLPEAVNEAEQPIILPFTDVQEDDWFYDTVMYAYANNLFNGTSETTFEPNATMTRAMFITVLYRMEGEPDVTGTNPFTDVPNNDWYTDAVIWANANGLVNGVTETSCAPDDSITREQAAAVLMRYANYKDYDTTAAADLDRYVDQDQISDWAYRAMQWANRQGLIIGRTETALDPLGTATRAEVAALLMRFLESGER